jgi:hypothetical protein
LIKRLRSEGKNLLILDAGNLFFLKSPKSEGKRREYIRRSDVLVRAYNTSGYDAVNIGERDLILGYQFLTDIAERTKFPFISANLREKGSHQPFFKPYIIKDITGLKVGIFGLIDNRVLRKDDPMITALDTVQAARSVVKDLKKHCDIIIALSQLGEVRDRKLVQAVPDIDVVIGGGKSKTIRYEKVRNTIMARLIPRGGYLGILDLRINKKVRPYRFQNMRGRDELLKKIERIRFRYRHIEDRMEGLPSKEKKLKQKEVKILKERERQLQVKAVSYDAANTFNNERIPVNIRIEDDTVVAGFIEEYRRKVAEGKQGREETKLKGQPMGLSDHELLASVPTESLYRSAISCKRCHSRNYNAWLQTKHAKATETIIENIKESTSPGQCLPCHTTGYGEVDEYETFGEIPVYLWGVQCETCHGPGKGHPGFSTRFRKVTLGRCRTCHTKDQSPAFHYRSYLLRIGCTIRR